MIVDKADLTAGAKKGDNGRDPPEHHNKWLPYEYREKVLKFCTGTWGYVSWKIQTVGLDTPGWTDKDEGWDKNYSIVIDGVNYVWNTTEISHELVVAHTDYDDDSIRSVKYKNGCAGKPEGILSPGESVPVNEGMVFTTAHTGNA